MWRIVKDDLLNNVTCLFLLVDASPIPPPTRPCPLGSPSVLQYLQPSAMSTNGEAAPTTANTQHVTAKTSNSASAIGTLVVDGDTNNIPGCNGELREALWHGQAQRQTTTDSEADSGWDWLYRPTPARSTSEVSVDLATTSNALEQAPIRLRRPQQRNWESVEILALIRAKVIEHCASRNVVDAHIRMKTAQQKWLRIYKAVMVEGASP